ncbi:MAG: FAD-dependent oxidoreductase [Paenibacillus macerans]|uniref:Urocanate reductase n=1 Tax=Paenibacillus macerans TaxID=44252 RepID=A0A6N8ESD8_PAEMA|nr:FAD-dependent oxidoreductase [Paenibacillus macerans]MBS5911654.1 FAD-dependent oxidoreductase [Paenibacillus macerans]MDU7474585.1 FAD-dependent oxidoreductase [Paenibacillus macerans]MEC0141206.1 FAD-dependent oxidoreductase [Paenibacillus macerans]MEC0330335.1 FAD-dependent oxidoreductase [Paenibacillus macerans]MUG22849.1 FAD-dependent oxidoreductase [Paenibacillus macerans]
MSSKKRFKSWLVFTVCLALAVSVLSGCQSAGNSRESGPSSAPEQSSFKAGTYTGEAEGKDGTVKVEVTMEEPDQIKDIQIVSQTETEGLGDAALEKIKEQILQNQTLAVDAVSGASKSSEAMLTAVEKAVQQAGGDLTALKSGGVAKAGEGKTEKLQADVVVVGAGASGVSAAVTAADKGAKVIIVEKTGVIGGASNLSWAGKFYNSSAAVENGIKVNVEQEIADWIANNHWRVDAAAIRQYVTKSGETYDWLKSKGYVTTFLNFAGEQLHVLPAYDTREQTLRKMLAASVEKNGGQVITETTAKELMTDASGAVVGVKAAKADGTTLEISAKSVVMATGGYAGNKEMVKEAFGFEGVNGGLGQNIGEGLKMSWAVGAKVPDNFGGQMLHQTLARATSGLKKEYSSFEASYPLMLSYLPTLMNVGPSGARFRDEAATLTSVAAANTSAFNGPYHLVIVSKAQLDALEAKGMNGVKAPGLPGMPPEFYADFSDKFKLDTPWTNVEQVFESMVKNGDGYKGDTIEKLAQNAGMDAEVFKEAFDNYTEATKTGVDTDFGKAKQYLVPMGEGPYYAIIAEINNLGSVGGLLVNPKFQVLGEGRVPIKGLYAVGLESEGVLFNDTYVGNGVGIGYSFTSGRLGGESAAAGALGK